VNSSFYIGYASIRSKHDIPPHWRTQEFFSGGGDMSRPPEIYTPHTHLKPYLKNIYPPLSTPMFLPARHDVVRTVSVAAVAVPPAGAAPPEHPGQVRP
jgi:hypothetical protein